MFASVPFSIPGFTDPVSSLSHLLGAGLFAVLGIWLLREGRGDRRRLIFLGVYVFACVFLLSMSGVFHLLARDSGGREVLARLDHGAIFVLIAGTFTPVHGILYLRWARWLPLLVIWGAAITGITLKTIFFRGVSDWLGLTFYLGLGWIEGISGFVLWYRYGWTFVRPLIWGALAYSFGAVLEARGWPTLIPGVVGPHELWHFAVLAGAFWHWQFVSQFASGAVPGMVRAEPASVRVRQSLPSLQTRCAVMAQEAD